MTLKVAVLGASGFAGGELLRLLARHPELDVVASGAGARAGLRLDEVHPQLLGAYHDKTLSIDEAAATDCDALFSCLPSGELEPRLSSVAAPAIIDLSDEFRADASWTYGLTEHARAEVGASSRVANPGCYPTAALLALLPFARSGLIEGPVVIDAISGISGAGRKEEDRLMFSTVDGGVGAYGSIPHRHVAEIEASLKDTGGMDATVSFTPHLAPMARGLVATTRAPLAASLTDAEALDVLRAAYAGEAFVSVLESWPQTKPLTGTNNAHVSARVDARVNMLVAGCAIDNLGKGAAGQALQNLNLMLGIDELTGLENVGVWP